MPEVCLLIPVFNHPIGIRNTLEKLEGMGYTCVVVDDGSEPGCAAAISDLAARFDWVRVIRHTRNRGKGAAVKTGLSAALELGFSHALQLDADEQHDLSALAPMVSMSEAFPEDVVLGLPQYDESIPMGRLVSRYLTHVWVWINTLSLSINDSMCGFRVYPTAMLVELTKVAYLGDRMDFDVEVLVKLHWRGAKFRYVPVRTTYPEGGVSHFRLLEDNWLITKMHTRCFFGMLIRLVPLLKRKVSGAQRASHG